MPKARKPVETFPMFLRRCGQDHHDNGMRSTAEDYFKAADEIDRLNSHTPQRGEYIVNEKALMDEFRVNWHGIRDLTNQDDVRSALRAALRKVKR